jgi:4-hydroxy-3-methylbut-2-enyl diphosphate reductase
MARKFEVPAFYRSDFISEVKALRVKHDPKRRDLSPSRLSFGEITFLIPRHFGFCYGVENAIHIAYRAIEENPDKRVFLLSEMIHNPDVNRDLESRGVKFLMNTDGSSRISFDELKAGDIVIIPAFGTTVELQQELTARGIDPQFYDTTCPFVEKVWKRAEDLGKSGYTVVLHGKRAHEETRATFSHSKESAPTLVVRDMNDTDVLIQFLKNELSIDDFYRIFDGAYSSGFDAEHDLKRIGVVNQTTMLASETQAIAEKIRAAMLSVYGEENLNNHFADTRDTLCYATNENQSAAINLLTHPLDIALVVGGYNSSNTSHLVELAEDKVQTFYIKDAEEILSDKLIRHFDIHSKTIKETSNWLPLKDSLQIALSSGASCPDVIIEDVIKRILQIRDKAYQPKIALEILTTNLETTNLTSRPA